MRALRRDVIEAMAWAIHPLNKQLGGVKLSRWEDEPDQGWYRKQAKAALDAALDTLIERSELKNQLADWLIAALQSCATVEEATERLVAQEREP